MKIGTRFLASMVLLGASVPAVACEPIVPFVKAVGGPGFATIAFVSLAVVVVLKSAAFARLQTKLAFLKALLWMLVANIVTSIIGLAVPAMIDSGAVMFIGVPLVWAACLFPAQRLIAAAPLTPFARFTSGQLAFGMTMALAFSYLLLLVSNTVHDSANFLPYWFFKLPVLFLALLIGLVLTAFWEEWIVWRLSRSEDDDITFVRPVIRANLIVLAAVMLISAGVVFPKRFSKTVNAAELIAKRQSASAPGKAIGR
jgi:hypothetical protein